MNVLRDKRQSASPKLAVKSTRVKDHSAPKLAAGTVLTMNVPQSALTLAQANELTTAQQLELGQRQSLQFEQIAQGIQALPGVKSVGAIDDLPLGSQIRQASRFVIEGRPIPAAEVRPVLQFRTVSLGYFSSLGIPLLRGRLFTPDDLKLQNVTVINETMERRFWPKGDYLGKRINLCSLFPTPCWSSVIGVVGNVHQFGLDAEPTLYAGHVQQLGGSNPLPNLMEVKG